MKKVLVLLLSALVLVFLAGCDDEMKELNVVFMPQEGAATEDVNAYNASIDRFKKGLEEATGLPVKVHESVEYSIGITAIAQGTIDILLVSPMSYYHAQQQADVEPLVSIPMPGYKSVFLARSNDDTINNLSDLRNKKFAYVDNSSSSGYLYPKYELMKNLNLNADTMDNNNDFFSTVAFSGSQQNSVISLLNGQVDAVSVAAQMIEYIPSLGAYDMDDVKVVAETNDIPSPLFIMRSDIPEEYKKSIKDFYTGYDDEKYFEIIHGDKNVRYAIAREEDYADTLKLVEALGIEAE